MLRIIKSRILQGYRTGKFPYAPPVLPERFCGVLKRDASRCDGCGKCAAACPTGALATGCDGGSVVDRGLCIGCNRCVESCDAGALVFTGEHRLGRFSREALKLDLDAEYAPDKPAADKLRRLIGGSLKIRQISVGGCAACELDFNVLHTLAWDIGRFGIQAVASPRHADALLITGPVSKNMLLALEKTVAATPKPRWVIACGSCAISGGIYKDSPVCVGAVDRVVKVDLYVPGCPPHPAVLLEALLRLMKG